MKKLSIVMTALVFCVVISVFFIRKYQASSVAAQNQKAVFNNSTTSAVNSTIPDEVCVGTNLLQNPSFEGEYEPYIMPPPGHPDCQTWNESEPNQYCERVKVAVDWHPYWRSAPRTEVWENIQPEYVPSLPHEMPPRVRSGEKSQHYFSFWSTHEAGFYQQVTAVPGGEYCFNIWGHAWSARVTPPGFLSDPNDHGHLHQRVGIDPTGGTDWQNPNIIWSDERMQYDEFGLFSIKAVAQSDIVTVFAYSRPDIPVKHNDVYWDDATLVVNKHMSVDKASVAYMIDIDDPPTILSQPIAISGTIPLSWTAVLDSGSLNANLSHNSGSSSESVTVSIDTSGYAIGTYTTNLTISSSEDTTGSPRTIPLTLVVVEDVQKTFLPIGMQP